MPQVATAFLCGDMMGDKGFHSGKLQDTQDTHGNETYLRGEQFVMLRDQLCLSFWRDILPSCWMHDPTTQDGTSY